MKKNTPLIAWIVIHKYIYIYIYIYSVNPAEKGKICKFGVMPSREPFSLFL
jgi:hypothetical protein